MTFSLFKKSVIKLIKSNSTYITLSISIASCILYFMLFEKVAPLDLMLSNTSSNVSYFTDQDDGGGSIVNESQTSNQSISMNYILKSGFVTPYAGFTRFGIEKFGDFSKYDIMRISLSGQNIENLYIHVSTKDKSVKNKAHRLANRISAANINLYEGKFDGTISFSQFETPTWWAHAIQQSINDFGAIEWNNLLSVSVVTGSTSTLDMEQEITLKSVIFDKDYLPFIWKAIIMQLVLTMLLFIYQYKNVLRSQESQIIVSYRPIVTNTPKQTTQNNKCLEYINEHYNDPDLTLTTVSKATGVSERNISKLINELYACNFRTYVNNIRIAEAERLLTSTSFSISEIGYKVGFNDPSAFSKTYKKLKGTPPSSSKQNTNN